ncbi:Z1 domain protein [Thalassoglobus polymorphus]|uniref:Z1 domain protein n=2 Tax=Thalassoglobus polymorphus TaxID=2527994 RepID=A0A517QQR2_9PLAN|nr:Z1 domain protein [Thalassoglobus polymorphus]
MGKPITSGLIKEKISEICDELSSELDIEISEEDVKRLEFQVGLAFNVQVGEKAVVLPNKDLPRWFDAKKSEIDFAHWDAYREMLESKGRAMTIVDANEEVINNILDFSGDPTTPGKWSRKGLVMGNVQSGKTQNYLGLINKAIDSGYRTIILLGGHLNDLRRQTQERVDEGVLGRESRHLAEARAVQPERIGVGLIRDNEIDTGTTTIGDFNKNFADRFGFKLSGSKVVIFTIKKHTGVMERLYDWIRNFHYLDPGQDKKLDGPLLLIDDEADYASINTKHHREEVTRTNEFIRKLLTLFHRNTYVGYTATPFANIFIDPDDASYADEDDIFPSDFMIRIPVPDNYMGQDYFFGQGLSEVQEEGESDSDQNSPTIPIYDHQPVYRLKKDTEVSEVPESLKEAVRAFLLVIAIRSLRGEKYAHNTMLVNISHLKVHQNQLERLLANYHRDVLNALESFAGLGIVEARKSDILKKMEDTFHKVFSVAEEYEDIFSRLVTSAQRVKVWAINQSSRKDDRNLDYSKHSEFGLCAIVIGGHKLSRGLTLEGLSISYFARNSKAYDTLMQMCRWFGYRPNYEDLCRVYLPEESIEWYSFISTAIRELYQELELMARKEARPREFGLKVREHPGAMLITAKNKIGWAESEIRSQDLWGQVQRRFRFRPDPEVNRRNLEFTTSFITRLMEAVEHKTDTKTGAVCFPEVSYSDVIEFITEMDLPEDDLGNGALIKHLKKMEEMNLAATRVVLFNQMSKPLKLKWEAEEKDLTDHNKFDQYKNHYSEGIRNGIELTGRLEISKNSANHWKKRVA